MVPVCMFNVGSITYGFDGRVPGAHPRGAEAPPLETWKALYFQGLFRQITWFASFKSVLFSFLLCRRTEEACSMVNSLRKVDFSHPTGHYPWTNFRSPLEKILGAPLSGPIPWVTRNGATWCPKDIISSIRFQQSCPFFSGRRHIDSK